MKYKIVFDPTLANGDSIAAYLTDAAGSLLTSSLVGGAQALDVNVVQSVLPAGAATETSLAALLLEIQNLSFADGAAWAASSMGISALAVRKDASGALTGVADGDWTPLLVDANGLLKVSATVTFGGEYAEDSASADGNVGLFGLYVRRDAAGTHVGADGDYAEGQVSGTGEMRMMNVQDVAVLETKTTLALADTAQPMPAVALANRKKMWVQNISDKPIFVGSASVTTATGLSPGLEISKGGYEVFDVGPHVDLYGVCGTNAKDVVTLEFS